jgi:exopolyphosphatase/guanosine-5'-triphosphate,3'-diphosphate pyrophosphatase
MRFNVDEDQARRVARTARLLLDQCAAKWQLEMPLSVTMLDWSARLHEIGLDISHDGFQRHGAYIAEHAELPGFPRAEQRLIAFLIGSQRREINSQYQAVLPRAWRRTALRLVMLLRLAVLLNRSRSQVELPAVDIDVGERSLALRFDPDWLGANPLTVADLEREIGFLQAVGYELRVS